MRDSLFTFHSYRYEINDWRFKKKGLLNRINRQEFTDDGFGYRTDRVKDGKSYIHYLSELLNEELSSFCQEAQVTCHMTDAWTTRYKRGDSQGPHNHRSWGFSGIIYVEFDPKIHTPTWFISPWQDPRNDTTSLAAPKDVKEGTMIIFPSSTLHYVRPNQSNKERTITSFDLLPQCPKHQSITN